MFIWLALIFSASVLRAQESNGAKDCLTSYLEFMAAGETRTFEYNNQKVNCQCLKNGRYKCHGNKSQVGKRRCLFEDQYYMKAGNIALTFTGKKFGCSRCFCNKDGTIICRRKFCIPVNGGYSEWGSWSRCPQKDCHNQISRRMRRCSNPTPRNGGDRCQGAAIEARLCDARDCQGGELTEWSEWSTCSKLCGKGKKIRNRLCIGNNLKNGDKTCVGETSEIQSCFVKKCPQISIDCTLNGIIVNIPNSIAQKLSSTDKNEVSLFHRACVLPNDDTEKQAGIIPNECTGLLFNKQNLTILGDLLKKLNEDDRSSSALSEPSITDQVLFCALNAKRKSISSAMVQPKQIKHSSKIKVYTSFDTYLQLTNEKGDRLASGKVIPVIPGQRVYFSVLITANKTRTAADRCYVSPTQNEASDLKYELIKDGCKQDDSVILHGPDGNGQRYSFEAFSFISDPSLPLYVHCSVRLCPSHIKNSFCRNPCPFNKQKRTIEDLDDYVYELKAALV